MNMGGTVDCRSCYLGCNCENAGGGLGTVSAQFMVTILDCSGYHVGHLNWAGMANR